MRPRQNVKFGDPIDKIFDGVRPALPQADIDRVRHCGGHGVVSAALDHDPVENLFFRIQQPAGGKLLLLRLLLRDRLRPDGHVRQPVALCGDRRVLPPVRGLRYRRGHFCGRHPAFVGAGAAGAHFRIFPQRAVRLIAHALCAPDLPHVPQHHLGQAQGVPPAYADDRRGRRGQHPAA